jgi:hypothetical protein
MNTFTQAAAVLALKKMFTQNYFDICTIDSLVKASGVLVPPETYAAWRLLHCVHYDTMSPEFRAALMEQVIETFKAGPAFDVNRLNEIAGCTAYLEPQESKSTTLVIVQKERKWLPW